LLLPKVTVKQKEDLSFRGSAGICLGQAPYIDPKLFIGRESELDQMKEILKPGGKSREHRRLVLGGKGGIGKTQLVIAYANRHRDDYKSVFWLNAASEATVKDSFRSIADRLFDVQEPGVFEGEKVVIHVHRWLSDQENTQWLLIFDNYDDPGQFNIQKYYPFASHGAIVVTTRRPDLVAGREIRIEPLENIEESLEILETRSQRKDAKTGEPSTTTSIVH
jgi:Cdc6-like AAA superfamily ATPase